MVATSTSTSKRKKTAAGLLVLGGLLWLGTRKAGAGQLECADAIGPESGTLVPRGRGCTSEEIDAGGTQWATANVPEITDDLGTHLWKRINQQWVVAPGGLLTVRFCVKNIGQNAGSFSFCHCNSIFGSSFCNALSGRIFVEPGQIATSAVAFTLSAFLGSDNVKTLSPTGTDCTGLPPGCAFVGGLSAQWDPPGIFAITRPVEFPSNIGSPTDDAIIEGLWLLSGDLVFIRYSDGTQASYARQLFREAGIFEPVDELPGLTFLEFVALVPAIEGTGRHLVSDHILYSVRGRTLH